MVNTGTNNPTAPDARSAPAFPPELAEDLLKLATVAAKRINGRHDDELVSDICADVLRSFKNYDPTYQFSTFVNRVADCRAKDRSRAEGRYAKKIDACKKEYVSELFASVDFSRRGRGRPPMTDEQKIGIAKFAVENNLTARAVCRFLKKRRDARRAIGLKRAPVHRTVCMAIRWASEHGYVTARAA